MTKFTVQVPLVGTNPGTVTGGIWSGYNSLPPQTSISHPFHGMRCKVRITNILHRQNISTDILGRIDFDSTVLTDCAGEIISMNNDTLFGPTREYRVRKNNRGLGLLIPLQTTNVNVFTNAYSPIEFIATFLGPQFTMYFRYASADSNSITSKNPTSENTPDNQYDWSQNAGGAGLSYIVVTLEIEPL